MGHYEWERCPYCGYILEHRRGVASRNPVGPPYDRCPQCGKQYATGRKEWADLDSLARFLFALRVVWWTIGRIVLLGVAPALLVAVILKARGVLSDRETLIVLVTLGTVLILLQLGLIVYGVTRMVRESIARTTRPPGPFTS
jgi:hypothetical protein